MAKDFIQINKSYQQAPLENVAADPFVQFATWFAQAQQMMPNELVNAMTLATVDANNKPSARMVLLKHFDTTGFMFFTNYQSKKGQDMDVNPHVALLFWWDDLAREVRIEGRVEKVNAQVSDHYFHSRARLSQLAAVVSLQSTVIKDYAKLQQDFLQLQRCYADESVIVPRPAYWGGYIVKPDLFEFWQGGEHRLHDRFQYSLTENDHWSVERLAS